MGQAIIELYFFECGFCSGFALLLGDALVEEGDLDVFEDGELRDEVEGLEDEAEFLAADL